MDADELVDGRLRIGRALADLETVSELSRLVTPEADHRVDELGEDLLGVSSATSSISTPPSVVAITAMRRVSRSTTSPR